MAHSPSKIKLNALLVKLQDRVHFAKPEECDEVIQVMRDFASNALAEKRCRQSYSPVTDVLLEDDLSEGAHNKKMQKNCVCALTTVVGCPGPIGASNLLLSNDKALPRICLMCNLSVAPASICPLCNIQSSRSIVCNGCNRTYLLCCAGYEREPTDEMVQTFSCKTCLASNSAAVVDEFLPLEPLFDSWPPDPI